MTVEQTITPPELNTGVLDEQAELLIVRNIRLQINKQLMADGQVPSDSEKLDFLMTNLRDMDKSALSRSKIKSDEKVATNTNETISMVTQVFQALRGNKELPPKEITEEEKKTGEGPTLPEGLSERTFVPGETQVGTIQEDIDAFNKRMNSNVQ